MKISEMILREDFYEINRKTLAAYYSGSDVKTELYIYPKINALLTRFPGRRVRKYLYTEYRIRKKPLKRMLVSVYLAAAFHSFGLLASERITVNGVVSGKDLIYPCNRKYRIFHFENDEVTVLVKDSFSNESIKKEVDFRKEHKADFILPILDCGERYYTEKIIDGLPLARLGRNYEEYEVEALRKMQLLGKGNEITAEVSGYLKYLKDQIRDGVEAVAQSLSEEELALLRNIQNKLGSFEPDRKQVTLCLSHGDLQPGNIWVERQTGRLYIIDWESWDKRSAWYDKAVLKCDIRNGLGIKTLLEGGYRDIFAGEDYECVSMIVAMEDLIYKLRETAGLPGEYGVRQFVAYMMKNYETLAWIK